MGVSYDYASSMLLCGEDNSSILDVDDDGDELGTKGKSWGSGMGKIYDQKTVFFRDSFMIFPLQTEECLFALLEKESEHLPARDYAKRLKSGALDMSVRKDAVDWIRKQGKAWMTQLLAVACLSLAAKMEETEVPLSLDLQIANSKYVFEAKTIQRMELLVLSTLKWRMQSVTPFSFIDYFLHMFNDGNSPKEWEIHRCVELILCTVKGIALLEFRPSEVAAAVAMTAFSDARIVCMENALNCCPYVQKKKVMQCYEAIQDMRLMNEISPSISSVPQSPIGVLDAKCLSYKSDQTIAASQENSQNNSQAAKKRKLNSA
ncbi:hypothetical protein IEQ34_019119 [Dendrobium chrysotoxum]|uniref:Cyclin C-terminal domain-containing protein n=1 Tax=Dendrobium chrysotoxum TaxID=161865 RepID=A0AAV7G7Q6_DENCH|nr:hypothetical protein IEQ34_019119 [Dendrobium chrysotoxum]